MKKLLIIAAAALLAAACAKTYEVKETTPPAIGFGTWTETLTKATNHDPTSASFGANDNFSVYGHKTLSSGSSVVFKGTTVSYNGTAWTYSPKRFWDNSATQYVFYAVSPAGLVTSATQSSNAFTGTLSGSATFDGNTDVLVAAEKTVTTYTSAVDLKFHHIASLLDLKVRKTNDLELGTEDENNYIKVEITSISLSQIDATGTFTIDQYTGENKVPGKASGSIWSTNSTASKATYTNANGYAPVSTLPDDIPAVSEGSSSDLISKLVVMPQTFRTEYASAATEGNTDQTVTIAYNIKVCESGTLTTSAYSASFDLKEFDDTGASTGYDTNTEANYIASWQPNKHYIYLITIGANAITFTASIQAWDTTTINGYHYLTQ